MSPSLGPRHYNERGAIEPNAARELCRRTRPSTIR